jgi:hypothetical protein
MHVTNVLNDCAEIEVFGVPAYPVIAMVQDPHAFGDATVVNQP